MKVGDVVRFHDERFFEGAVQLRWVETRPAQARQAAESFVFHGPRYHGAGAAEEEGIEGGYRLKDSASLVLDLLASLQAGTEGAEENPYWLVVAGYGSGKSHLALTCALLLGEPQGATAGRVLTHLSEADAEIGDEVRRRVEGLDKPVLVLPLDGMAGFHLGNALSRAVFAQLRHHGVDAGAVRDLSPRFQTAEQFVERNYSVRIDHFTERLPGLDREEIRRRLQDNDEAVYTEVDAIYTDANGVPIPVVGQESAQELIETLCTVYCGPEGAFSSVVILFDEFGRYLEYAAEKPQLAGDAALQQIFQGVQDNSAKVRFLGFIQYELKAYLKRFAGADLRQLQRYITRFEAARKWYLSTNLETLFAHMIGKDEGRLDAIWAQTGADATAAATRLRLARSLPGFERLPVWNTPDQFSRVIARGAWPLHPLATWFLTRQRDVVQSRSALTFIKEMVERIAAEEVAVDTGLRQVSAAELVLRSMLPELIAAEREVGGGVAETLQTLLEKFRAHLDGPKQLVLAGVAVLEKMRVGRQNHEAMDQLLCEATALDGQALGGALRSLTQELGALEWNRDLGQYELIADASTRGQFQQWLRKKLAMISADAVRDLYVRRGAKDIELGDIVTDFGQRRDISTPDWYFDAQLAHAGTVEQAIRRAFGEWENAVLPKQAKGKAIYLYLHPEDDAGVVEDRVRASFQELLARAGQRLAPIWVIAVTDRHGTITEHIARLYLFEEQTSAEDRERFRRFVPEEIERSRQALKETVSTAIKERVYWVAGFDDVPTGRLKSVGSAIFTRVYPQALPFPFDGFASSAGGGPLDAAQLIRSLATRQVNGPWVQAQPRRLQNRVQAVLVRSWRALLPSGKLSEPAEPRVHAVYEWLRQAHQDDPKRTLWASHQVLIAPPYGMNTSSAGLLLGILIGGEHPPRRIEQRGEMVASADWISTAFPAQKGRHHLEPEVLQQTTLHFLSEDSEGRWRVLLARWEAEANYRNKVALAKEAEVLRSVDPLPEVLEGNYKYLRDESDKAASALREATARLEEWERGVEKAERMDEVGGLLKYAALILRQRDEMQADPRWPDELVQEREGLLTAIRPMVASSIGGWLPRQSCHSTAQVADFRGRMHKAVASLRGLGFEAAAKALEQQAQHSIFQVEKRQKFALTLAESEDYPRQPAPTESTPVRELRDEITKGELLIEGVQEARSVLQAEEVRARVLAIEERQRRLRSALDRQRNMLGGLYSAVLDGEGAVRDVLARANRLRELFVGTPDEIEVSELVLVLERVLADIAAWERGDVSVERMQELLEQQIAHQTAELKGFLDAEEIEPPWHLEGVYQSLAAERIEAARRRSDEWLRPRLAATERVEGLGQGRCRALERELEAAPGYLSEADRERIGERLQALRIRRAELERQDRAAKVKDWQAGFPLPDEIDGLDVHRTRALLKELRTPPVELLPVERQQMEPLTARLTAHLDRMSMEEIVARIERLPLEHQRELVSLFSRRLGL